MRNKTRQGPGRFAMVPACAFDDNALTFAEVMTLSCVCTYLNGRHDGWWIIEQKLIADRLGIARETVNRHVKKLAQLGYLFQRPLCRADGGKMASQYCVNMNITIPPERYRSLPEDYQYEEQSEPEPVGGVIPDTHVTPGSHTHVTQLDHMDVTQLDHMDVTQLDHMDVTQLDHIHIRKTDLVTDQETDKETDGPARSKKTKPEPEPEPLKWATVTFWCINAPKGKEAMAPFLKKSKGEYRREDIIAAWNSAHPNRLWGIQHDREVLTTGPGIEPPRAS